MKGGIADDVPSPTLIKMWILQRTLSDVFDLTKFFGQWKG